MRALVLACLFAFAAGCSSPAADSEATPPPPAAIPPTPGPIGQPTQDPGDEAIPHVVLVVDESNDRLMVDFGTDPAANWQRLDIAFVQGAFEAPFHMGQAGDSVYQNEKALITGVLLPKGTAVAISSASEPLFDTESEYVEICADGQGADVDFKVTDRPSGELVGTYRLTNVAAC